MRFIKNKQYKLWTVDGLRTLWEPEEKTYRAEDSNVTVTDHRLYGFLAVREEAAATLDGIDLPVLGHVYYDGTFLVVTEQGVAITKPCMISRMEVIEPR